MFLLFGKIFIRGRKIDWWHFKFEGQETDTSGNFQSPELFSWGSPKQTSQALVLTRVLVGGNGHAEHVKNTWIKGQSWCRLHNVNVLRTCWIWISKAEWERREGEQWGTYCQKKKKKWKPKVQDLRGFLLVKLIRDHSKVLRSGQ